MRDVDRHLDRDRRPASERSQRRTKPAVRQLRRVDAARQLLHLFDHRLQVALDLLEPSVCRLLFGGDSGAELAQTEYERNEPLLRSIVQVALDPPSRLVTGLDQPHTRCN